MEEQIHDDDTSSKDEKPSQQLLLMSLEQNCDDIIDEDALQIFGDLEKILGDDPSQKMKKEVNLHQTLVSRWKDWLVNGLSRKVINELTDKYPRTGNCNLEAPILNPEVMHSLKESAQKRDKHFVHAQNLAGSALSALGMVISGILREEPINKLKLLEQLSDAAKLLVEVHHKESVARSAYILPGMSKQIKTVLEETKPDTFLFGHGLAEKLQDAIALEKLGKELKAQNGAPVPKKVNPRPQGSTNWKNLSTRQLNLAHTDNRSRIGPNRTFQPKSRSAPYHAGPLRPQSQSRAQNSRPDIHRRP